MSPIDIYSVLFAHFGPQKWWPMDIRYHSEEGSDPRFEVIVGAILTQNTAWPNVEKAICNLKEQRLLSIQGINTIDIEELKELILPSGFFNQKAYRLKKMSSYLHEEYHDDLDELFSQPILSLRNELLDLNGIGPETADSILLYAGEKPIFVVDAYTKRLCTRLSLPINTGSYDDIQQFFQESLSTHTSSQDLCGVYNEFHAVIVEWAKNFCLKRNPQCVHCPLISLCAFYHPKDVLK